MYKLPTEVVVFGYGINKISDCTQFGVNTWHDLSVLLKEKSNDFYMD